VSTYHKAKMPPAAGDCQNIQARLDVESQLECLPSKDFQVSHAQARLL